MKKSLIYIALLSLISLTACRDEALNPVPVWEPAVHAFGVFDTGGTTKPSLTNDYLRNFPASGQDASTATVPLKIRWVSLDNKLTVSKIDVYIEMFEFYKDADGNDKKESLGRKIVKTISSPAGNRQWNSIAITGTEAYNLFKDATVKYDKVNAVKVFENPANPRPKGVWFNGSEDFVITWVLTTTEGKIYNKFNESSICGDPTSLTEASANCRLKFNVNPCAFEGSLFEGGTWAVALDEWQDFKVGTVVRVKPGPAANELTVQATATDVDQKDIILTVAKDGKVTVAKQSYGQYSTYAQGGNITAAGSGSVNGCKGLINLTLEHVSPLEGSYGTYKLNLVRK